MQQICQLKTFIPIAPFDPGKYDNKSASEKTK